MFEIHWHQGVFPQRSELNAKYDHDEIRMPFLLVQWLSRDDIILLHEFLG
jgi:hypothetical protein